MFADINLQVWFDAHANQGQTLIVPYIKAERDVRLQYELKVLNRSKTGTSNVSQGGEISVPAGQPKAVSSIRVMPQAGGQCEVDLTLRENGEQVGQYTFDCGVKK